MCSSADPISQQPSLHREINTPRDSKTAFQLRHLCIQTKIYILNIVPACPGSLWRRWKTLWSWTLSNVFFLKEQGGNRHQKYRGQRSEHVEQICDEWIKFSFYHNFPSLKTFFLKSQKVFHVPLIIPVALYGTDPFSHKLEYEHI